MKLAALLKHKSTKPVPVARLDGEDSYTALQAHALEAGYAPFSILAVESTARLSAMPNMPKFEAHCGFIGDGIAARRRFLQHLAGMQPTW